MTKRFALLGCIAAAITVAACSSSTAPNSPSNATKGQTVDFSGTYNLSTFTFDSTDGGSWSATAGGNNTATLALTKSAYTLSSTGALTNSLSSTHGSYTATDTSSSAQRGTIVLYDSVAAKTQNFLYSYSSNTLTISAPNGDGNGNTIVTAWVKQ